MAQPRIAVRKRRKYASVDVDLWPVSYDLNDAGQEAAREVLLPYAKRPGMVTCGRTSMYAGRVPVAEAEALAGRLREIVLDPEHQQPIRARQTPGHTVP
jgi:hypothetical protein